ncbi:unnamed protein product [Rotaria sp. Silwood1]|nr:unnamed protein product [Rotaria sp. Silwood1]
MEELDAAIDVHGNTSLHIATRNGYPSIVKLLLQRGVCRNIINGNGQTAEQEASCEAIQSLFKTNYRPPPEANANGSYFVARTTEVEMWLDSYEHAYRISVQNQEYLKRWLIKIPYVKLIDELEQGYITTLNDLPPDFIQTLKMHMQKAKETESPEPLVKAYTEQQYFSSRLNTDLALLGSDFRFRSSQPTSPTFTYRDNEAPREVGQYIYAAILIHHHRLEQYHYADKTYRGMNITSDDFKTYAVGNIVLTRSFLSTSKERHVAEFYLNFDNFSSRLPVICIYTVKNPSSSLDITEMSQYKSEKEVLIVPFTAFEIVSVRENIDAMFHDERCLCEIELVECQQKPGWKT